MTYTLIIRKPTGPDSLVYKAEGLGDSTHQITEDIEIGSYEWFVIAEDADDTDLNTESSEIFSLTVIVGIDNEIIGIPEEYSLSQNYPNPFNPVTTINFALPMNSEVQLTIYNLRGEVVTRLLDVELKAGYRTVRWDATNIASGIYFYRLRAGNFVKTKKMLLLK